MQIDGPGPHYVAGMKYRIVELNRRSSACQLKGAENLPGQLVEVIKEYPSGIGWLVRLRFLEPNAYVKNRYGDQLTAGWYTPHLEPVSDVPEEEMAAWCAYDQEED